jgi:hypothetical protein
VEHVAAAENDLQRVGGGGGARAAGEYLVVVPELLFADGARESAVVATARLVLSGCPFL